jgi:S1-C subfamily serine protease
MGPEEFETNSYETGGTEEIPSSPPEPFSPRWAPQQGAAAPSGDDSGGPSGPAGPGHGPANEGPGHELAPGYGRVPGYGNQSGYGHAPGPMPGGHGPQGGYGYGYGDAGAFGHGQGHGPYGAGYGGPPPYYGGQGWGPPGSPAYGQGGYGQAPQPPQTPRRRSRYAAAAGASALLLAAAGGLIGYEIGQPASSNPSGVGFGGGVTSPSGSSAGGSSGSNGSSSGATAGPSNAASIAAKVDPGLVDIDTTIDYGAAEGAGTGMVLTSRGEVLTNNHVIEGATAISVRDVGNGKVYSATVVGYDSSDDVAILQLTNASGLKTVSIGNSSKAASGMQVLGIGNAGGAGGTPSYAGGTITATGQSLIASDSLTGTDEHLSQMIETNADIIPGDSGGPMVNVSGQVLGMDTAGSQSFQLAAQSSQSQGFAIPINRALSIAHEITGHRASSTVHVGPTAFLGVQIQESTSGSGGFGFSPPSTTRGAAISGVVSNGPAAAAGLGAGDVITSVGGHAVTSDASLQLVMDHEETPGRSVKVQYTDASGQQHTVTVTLASGPPA